MSLDLRIKISGDLPLPANAVEMARLILAVEEKIDALRRVVQDNGGSMTGDGWTVQGRKRKGEQRIVVVPAAPIPAKELLSGEELLGGLPSFLTGRAP